MGTRVSYANTCIIQPRLRLCPWRLKVCINTHFILSEANYLYARGVEAIRAAIVQRLTAVGIEKPIPKRAFALEPLRIYKLGQFGNVLTRIFQEFFNFFNIALDFCY